MDKTVVGLVEKIKIRGKEVTARIDTGAEHNSIDQELASKLGLGPVLKTILIRSASSNFSCPKCGYKRNQARRPVVEAEIIIKGKKIKARFNIANRKHMKYKLLIGQEILKQGFLINPSK